MELSKAYELNYECILHVAEQPKIYMHPQKHYELLCNITKAKNSISDLNLTSVLTSTVKTEQTVRLLECTKIYIDLLSQVIEQIKDCSQAPTQMKGALTYTPPSPKSVVDDLTISIGGFKVMVAKLEQL